VRVCVVPLTAYGVDVPGSVVVLVPLLPVPGTSPWVVVVIVVTVPPTVATVHCTMPLTVVVLRHVVSTGSGGSGGSGTRSADAGPAAASPSASTAPASRERERTVISSASWA